MANTRLSYQDMVNPLFLHPSDNATSIQVDKLEGSSDYRAWKRAMEINLISKRKLGFVKGTIPIPTDDPMKAEMWETCDNMVISWITANVSSTIKRSVLYMTSSKEIWNNLELRFSLTNGSRKYKLSKDLYDIKQGTLNVNDYYTAMRTVWEELDSMNSLPAISNPTAEIIKLLAEIDLQKEESKLFQFLNGLNDVYAPQRSQLLLLNPLPSVENASSVMQQEEAQRELLQGPKASNTEFLAMYSKGTNSRIFHCTACGGKGHTQDRCWTVVGYPKWHNNYKGNMGNVQGKPFINKPRWTSNLEQQSFKAANSAQIGESSTESTLFTPEQLSQLAQFMQLNAQDDSEALDTPFSGMMSSNKALTNCNDWIIDSGASDHMTPYLSNIESPTVMRSSTSINLPTGATAKITHTGNTTLSNGLLLSNVLCVPFFMHNLLSVQKLIKNNQCAVQFFPSHCVITDSQTHNIKAVGEAKKGLYYLVHTSDPMA